MRQFGVSITKNTSNHHIFVGDNKTIGYLRKKVTLMKIAVRYQSRGGNTKAVAEEIANIVGCKAESIDVPVSEAVDLLLIGGGVYAWNIDNALKEYIHTLNPDLVKSIAAFSTAGSANGTKKIITLARENGIPVCKNTLPIHCGARNLAWLGGKGYLELTDKQKNLISDFVKETIK